MGKGTLNISAKECDALPQERKNELQALDRLANAAMKYPRTRQDWDLLEKYAKNNKYPEARDFARALLGQDKPETISEGSEDYIPLSFRSLLSPLP